MKQFISGFATLFFVFVSVLTFLVMLFVIPLHVEVFADWDAELPPITVLALTVSSVFATFWYILLPIVLLSPWLLTKLTMLTCQKYGMPVNCLDILLLFLVSLSAIGLLLSFFAMFAVALCSYKTLYMITENAKMLT